MNIQLKFEIMNVTRTFHSGSRFNNITLNALSKNLFKLNGVITYLHYT